MSLTETVVSRRNFQFVGVIRAPPLQVRLLQPAPAQLLSHNPLGPGVGCLAM
jgi:hypothetical protein